MPRKPKITEAVRKERKAARMRAWRAANPLVYSEREKKRYREKDRNTEQKVRRALGVDRIRARDNDYYRRVLEAKAGRPRPDTCEVCGSDEFRIHFDHDHKTGAFRGWLCHHCNVALGHVRDSQWRLQALIDYLDAAENLLVAA